MTSSIGGFVSTWSPSFYSTTQRIELRNVRQGGNNHLAASPIIGQAMWGGSLLATVAAAVQGPFKWVALFFRWIFHPLIMAPLAIASCAVKEHFYESSVSEEVPQQTKHFVLGPPVPEPIAGTITLTVGDQPRHFFLGDEITHVIENSAEVEIDGQMKRHRFRRMYQGEPFTAQCRRIEHNGELLRVRIEAEVPAAYLTFIELNVRGRKHYFRYGNEVPEPVQGTVTTGNWPQEHYPIGPKVEAADPEGVTVKAEPRTLHYDTGKELSVPTPQSRSFLINGELRHFASAKLVAIPSHGLSGWINKIPRIPFKLPTRLNRLTVRALEFANDHMSNIVRVTILISTVALLYFGFYAMVAGAFLAVAYEYLNHDLGIIPHKVSLFMEKWMPMISMVGLLIVGSLTSQILAAVTLILMVPAVNLWAHQRISRVFRSTALSLVSEIIRWFTGGEPHPNFNLLVNQVTQLLPPLEECDAPFVETGTLNKAQIDRILAAPADRFEFNPAHLTNSFVPLLNLPENRNFNELNRLWEAEGDRWALPNTYTRLFNRLLDDERFFLFLKVRFPEAKPFSYEPNERLTTEQNRVQSEALQRAHKNQTELWIQQLAREGNYPNERAFLANWVKQQLSYYVAKLQGARPIEGEHRLLDDAIQNTAKILPFLLNPATSQVDREDALVKLAIEGGDYCSLGMKRASQESLDGFAEPLYLQAEPDPHKAYALEVRLALQKERLRAIQIIYREMIKKILSKSQEALRAGHDIHLYTALTRGMKRGIYPLEAAELNEFSLTELIFKETILLPGQVATMGMYQFQMPFLMTTLSIDRLNLFRNRTLDYLRNWVEQNNALSAPDKQQLLAGPLANTPDNLADHENYPKWYQLMLNIIGITRERQ